MSKPPRGAARPAVLLALLVAAVAINYVDRGSFAVANTDVAAEFRLDAFESGLLMSAFFWTYAACLVGAGWLVDRFDVKWVYAGGFLVWSLATLSTGLANGFAALLAARLLLGVGESVAYPATSRFIVETFPERRRGLANALVDAGSKVGPAASMLVGGLVVSRWGWRALFLLAGAASLVWLLPWIALVPSRPAGSAARLADAARPTVGFGQLLRRRELWGTSLGFFCLGYVWYFLVFWLPTYFETERGFSKDAMALFASLPLWVMAGTTVLAGWTSDRLIAAGRDATAVRKGFLASGFLLCAAFMAAAVAATTDAACVAFLTAACGVLGLYTSNVWAVTQTLAGPAAGRWTGVQNAIGNLGGVASPAITGWIVKETGSFSLAFTVASLTLVAGVAAYLALVGRVEPLDWGPTDRGPTDRGPSDTRNRAAA